MMVLTRMDTVPYAFMQVMNSVDHAFSCELAPITGSDYYRYVDGDFYVF